ncbi:hypothetical protein LCGC14_1629040 [marine sediment metagenome]|uniref:Uncharacterized protein n=1 Tax=marine sediment metagenome TaxID=412755 RepID=A0A0F9KIW2_9ZZZZ
MNDSESQSVINELNLELQETRNKNVSLQGALSGSSFQGNTENPISYQLDTSELKNQLEHFLKGDYIATNEEGEEYWKTQDDPEKVYFNSYGISSIMSKISLYLDKMTFLSNNDEQRIYEILAELGDALINFIYYSYEKMGMDTEFKRTNYELIIISLLNTIENAYKRSLRGATLDIINSSRLYTDNGGALNHHQLLAQKKKFSVFKPSTW